MSVEKVRYTFQLMPLNSTETERRSGWTYPENFYKSLALEISEENPAYIFSKEWELLGFVMNLNDDTESAEVVLSPSLQSIANSVTSDYYLAPCGNGDIEYEESTDTHLIKNYEFLCFYLLGKDVVK